MLGLHFIDVLYILEFCSLRYVDLQPVEDNCIMWSEPCKNRSCREGKVFSTSRACKSNVKVMGWNPKENAYWCTLDSICIHINFSIKETSLICTLFCNLKIIVKSINTFQIFIGKGLNSVFHAGSMNHKQLLQMWPEQ